MYEQKPNMQDELIMNDNRITQNAFSGKRLCPFEPETLINTGISGFSNHRKTHYKCTFGKTFPPLESETLINTGVSGLSNQEKNHV